MYCFVSLSLRKTFAALLRLPRPADRERDDDRDEDRDGDRDGERDGVRGRGEDVDGDCRLRDGDSRGVREGDRDADFRPRRRPGELLCPLPAGELVAARSRAGTTGAESERLAVPRPERPPVLARSAGARPLIADPPLTSPEEEREDRKGGGAAAEAEASPPSVAGCGAAPAPAFARPTIRRRRPVLLARSLPVGLVAALLGTRACTGGSGSAGTPAACGGCCRFARRRRCAGVSVFSPATPPPRADPGVGRSTGLATAACCAPSSDGPVSPSTRVPPAAEGLLPGAGPGLDRCSMAHSRSTSSSTARRAFCPRNAAWIEAAATCRAKPLAGLGDWRRRASATGLVGARLTGRCSGSGSGSGCRTSRRTAPPFTRRRSCSSPPTLTLQGLFSQLGSWNAAAPACSSATFFCASCHLSFEPSVGAPPSMWRGR